MDTAILVLIAIVALYVCFVLAVTLYLIRWLEHLPHERYDRRAVYAVDPDGQRWHIQRGLLERYMDIKSSRITELQGQPPEPIREIKLWTVTLGLPTILAPLIRALRGKEDG